METTISVIEAAKMLNIPAQRLRIGLQRDKYPFGNAVDMSGKGRYTYTIYRKRLEAFINATL